MFIQAVSGNAKASNILNLMIAEAREIRENQTYRNIAFNNVNVGVKQQPAEDSDEEDGHVNSETMIQYPEDCGTLVPSRDTDGTLKAIDDATLVPGSQNNTMVDIQSELGTMVINSDSDEATMKSKNLKCCIM